MKKLCLFFLSLILDICGFSLENNSLISIDGKACNSVWDIIQNKCSDNNIEIQINYKEKSLNGVSQLYRNILMDYAAFFVSDCEENDMLLDRVAYSLGIDLRNLFENQEYEKKISSSILALQLIAMSRIAGEASEGFGLEVKKRRDELKNIIDIVEKEAFGSDS